MSGVAAVAAPDRSLEKLAASLLGVDDIESALESTTVPALLHDGRRVLLANRSCSRFLGAGKRKRLQGMAVTELAAEADQKALLAALGVSPEGVPPTPHIQRLMHRNGTTLIANVLSRATTFGEMPAWLALFEGVSAGERSPRLLRLLEEAVDHLHDIVFITEAEAIDRVGRRIVFVNRAFTALTGYEVTDVLGKTPNITIGELSDRSTLARIETGLCQKRPVHEELLKYDKNGEGYWVELDILPVFDDDGQHTHWVSIQRDITERRFLEERFVENERLASVGYLSTKLVDEVNEPLAQAQRSLDWLAQQLPALLPPGEQAAQAIDALSRARSETRCVARTAKKLSLISGSGEPKLGPTNVCDVLDTALTVLQATKNVPGRIERKYSGTHLVMADASRLTQVFQFALENAASSLLEERRAQNSIVIEVREVRRRLLVSVEDTGIGMPSEVAEQLLSALGCSRRRTGPGLNLFIANCLVRELGGRLSVRECPHGGTLLEVLLPRASGDTVGTVAPI